METLVIVVAIGSILCNIGITALNFKLYTEYFKDRAITNRK